MTNNTHFEKRKEYISHLRHKAGSLQISALIFLALGLVLMILIRQDVLKSTLLLVGSLIILLLGIALEISSLIYFNKAKKHLSSQNITSNTNN